MPIVTDLLFNKEGKQYLKKKCLPVLGLADLIKTQSLSVQRQGAALLAKHSVCYTEDRCV